MAEATVDQDLAYRHDAPRRRDYVGDAFAIVTIIATVALPVAVALRLGL